jgi:hypothetical protein
MEDMAMGILAVVKAGSIYLHCLRNPARPEAGRAGAGLGTRALAWLSAYMIGRAENGA